MKKSLAGLAISLLIAGLVIWQSTRTPSRAPAPPAPPTYVGATACASCHQTEFTAWQGSQHELAMQPASEQSVRGNFADASFGYAGITSKFFRRDGHFFVNTDGPDGKLADFEIKYAFGVAPLQQYLVEFPDGRLQALSIAWDTRPAEQGGQRWFHLYPDEKVTHTDPLHWTKPSQNWNFMCAECHSTDLRRNYDVDKDRFATTWSDISVACEACHGPGSRHVAWAKDKPADDASLGLVARFEPRAAWTPDPATGAAQRATPRKNENELETCAVCHARRGQLMEGHVPGKPLADTHLPALLSAGLYQADGQMQDEVYNYGSFLQSKMHARGVSCSDCHEPHSLKLRAEGNAVCTQCHAARFDATEHTHHEPGSKGAACAACHMPVRSYMIVDRRHDHSFRVPRPDLSASLGTNNACTDCHQDRKAAWAAAAIEKWYGPDRKGLQNFGPALNAARTERRDAAALLEQVAADPAAPPIARATALAELAPYLTPALFETIDRSLADPDPLVRLGALRGLQGLPLERRGDVGGTLLSDPVRAVRLEAVSFLLAVPPGQIDASWREALERGVAEYLAVQRTNADRADARVNLGLMYQQRGDGVKAESEYRAAIALDPTFTPARVNLADLYRGLGRDADGERVLRDGLTAFPDDAALRHALGLSLVRDKRQPEALAELQRAAALAPTSARYAYVYAIALDSAGRRADAVKVLRENERRHPADRDTLAALVDLLGQQGDKRGALAYANNLAELLPGDPGVAGMIQSLQSPR